MFGKNSSKEKIISIRAGTIDQIKKIKTNYKYFHG